MKPTILLFVVFALCGCGQKKETLRDSPKGHWEGAMTSPTATELSFQVDLECDAAGLWSGSIDMPSQGLRGFKLSRVAVNDQTVAFTIPGVPGEPTFSGKLSDGGHTMNGISDQGGQTFPVRLERKPRSPASAETHSKGIPGEGLAGHWNGLLKVNAAIELRLALEIESNPTNGVEGAMVSLDQGNTRAAISSLSDRGGVVHLEFEKIGARFDGRMNTNHSELAGEWKQSHQTLPAVFHRVAKPLTLNRPQEPREPFPYSEENVMITNLSAGIILAGTLSIPRIPGPHPAVVLITGAGQQDRDEAIMGHRPFRVLADHLSRNGIAVLRCDDRGIGGSSGNFAQATDLDFVEDTQCCVNYLRTRKEIDPKRIGLIGHSEGGIIAPLVAVQSPDVAFIVLLAGVGVPMEELVMRQGRDMAHTAGMTDRLIAMQESARRKAFHLVRREKDTPTLETALRELFRAEMERLSESDIRSMGLSDGLIESQIQQMLSPWLRELVTYEPGSVLKRVSCPVLAINGEKDVQVSAKENLAAIESALKQGGNARVTVVELPGLNHLFQTCQTGALAEYGQIEETFAPAALHLVSEWIQQHTQL